MGEFGDKFRKERETKELTLDDVSKVTKIGSRMLQAIEEEHFDQLPGGVFNKGFIRAYAKHLGLDPEQAIQEYLSCVRQAQLDSQQAWQAERAAPAQPTTTKPAVDGASKGAVPPQAPVQAEELPELHLPRAQDIRTSRRSFAQTPSGGISWKFIGAAAALVVVLVFLWTRHSRSESEKPVAPAATASNTATAPARAASNAAANSSAPGSAPSSSPPTASNTQQPASPGSATSTNPLADATPAADIEDKNDVTIRNFGKPVPKTSQPAAGSFALVIRATENSWISVLADGQLVTEETLIAPAHTTIHASRDIVVKVGNAGAVSFLFNGKEIAPQGNAAEVKTLVFDSSGLKTAPAQTPPTPN